MSTADTFCLCPRCGGPIPDAEHPGQHIGALSRVDNVTEICSPCGRAEGVYNLDFPGQDLPPINQPVN